MNLKRTLLIGASALTLTMAASACSSSGDASDNSTSPPAATANESTDPAGSATAQPNTVEISASRFDTLELSVKVGDTVTFVNNDGYDHTVTSKDDAPVAFDSGKFGQGETFEVEFTEPGTYNYFCQIHPTMRATVIVG